VVEVVVELRGERQHSVAFPRLVTSWALAMPDMQTQVIKIRLFRFIILLS
jgi:hypothetical protein